MFIEMLSCTHYMTMSKMTLLENKFFICEDRFDVMFYREGGLKQITCFNPIIHRP